MPRMVWWLAVVSLLALSLAQTPEDLAASYGLNASTTLEFPQAVPTNASDAASFIVSKWGLSQGKVDRAPQDIAFVPDPFPSNATSSSNSTKSTNKSSAATPPPVLQITFPANSSSSDGGAQFLSLFNGTQDQQAMIVSYELAFDSTFDWGTGGFLPGMRGGPSTIQCSGSNGSTGHNCFSARLAWRTGGSAELFAYIPPSNTLCSIPQISCNNATGVNIDRATFDFTAGTWQRLTFFTWLNNPSSHANGLFAVYLNDMQVVFLDSIQIRAGSGVTTDGLWFDAAYLPSNTLSTDQHAYFRNIQIWSSGTPSNLSGPTVSNTTGNFAAPPLSALAFSTRGLLVQAICLILAVLVLV